MTAKLNPLKFNPLQLRTLTLLQAIARVKGAAVATSAGEYTIARLPQPHGDHFHVGDAVVSARDASGLYNESVWNALTRKGVARAEWPHSITLTATGYNYDTGLGDEILRRGKH